MPGKCSLMGEGALQFEQMGHKEGRNDVTNTIATGSGGSSALQVSTEEPPRWEQRRRLCPQEAGRGLASEHLPVLPVRC